MEGGKKWDKRLKYIKIEIEKNAPKIRNHREEGENDTRHDAVDEVIGGRRRWCNRIWVLL